MRPYIICHMIESLDGRKGMTASFDGGAIDIEPTLLTLQSVERMGDSVWMRYTIKT